MLHFFKCKNVIFTRPSVLGFVKKYSLLQPKCVKRIGNLRTALRCLHVRYLSACKRRCLLRWEVRARARLVLRDCRNVPLSRSAAKSRSNKRYMILMGIQFKKNKKKKTSHIIWFSSLITADSLAFQRVQCHIFYSGQNLVYFYFF